VSEWLSQIEVADFLPRSSALPERWKWPLPYLATNQCRFKQAADPNIENAPPLFVFLAQIDHVSIRIFEPYLFAHQPQRIFIHRNHVLTGRVDEADAHPGERRSWLSPIPSHSPGTRV
jgi:hypothetical protein